MGMNLDMAGINHQPFAIRFFYQTFLKTSPDALIAPTTKAAMGVLPVPVFRRQVAPRRPCAQNPENSVDKQSVITSDTTPLTFLPQ
jgi:hypothetical protein